VQPFTLEGSAVRGRLVMLSDVVNTILTRHDYPDAVSRVLGELLAVAAMLASNLKQDGIFTLQIRGSGRVSMLVVDAAYGGALRGYAQMSESAEDATLESFLTLPQLFGEDGALMITYDPGQGMQRYQGVVALEGDSVSDAIRAYFTQSQQVDLWLTLSCARSVVDGMWRAGGLMIERVAEAGGIAHLAENSVVSSAESLHELWQTSVALSATLTPAELLDSTLNAKEILYRLYHASDARVMDAQMLHATCRCSRERIQGVLTSMPLADRNEMLVDGRVSVTCQFCNQSEVFTPVEIGIVTLQ
jgi:molecular chaperone Hsp33